MGETRDLFKKIRDGHNKGQKRHGPNRSRNVKKRWQDYTEELYKKIFRTQISTMV